MSDNVHLIDHPLVGHLQTEMRSLDTGTERFRLIAEKLGEILAYEALRGAPSKPHTVNTPIEPYQGVQLAGPITIVPILRAGMGPAAGMARLIPGSQVGHIGMFRDEKSLTPVSYYVKLPRDIASGTVILVDPMLATGGSASAAVHVLKQKGCKDIRLAWLRRRKVLLACKPTTRPCRSRPVRSIANSTRRATSCPGWVMRVTGSTARWSSFSFP